jgi:hypothetical protein
VFFPPENDIAIDEIYCAELEQVPSSREPITDVEVIANREKTPLLSDVGLDRSRA